MEKTLEYTVPAADAGMTVKGILHGRLRLSVTQVRRAKFRPMGITLNGAHVTVRAVAAEGDVLRVNVEDDETGSHQLAPKAGTLDIVYEDDDLLAVNKPAGMPVHPSPGHYDDTLANLLVYTFQSRGQNLVVRTLGRLDRDTTGLILVAKNAPAQTALERQRADGTLTRIYLALTEGTPEPPCGTVDAPIGNVPGSLMKREVREDGAPSVTEYETLAAGGGIALVRLHLRTGRTHQIRVHMSHGGHPLVGDFLYGTEGLYGMERTALHSAELRFRHPATGKIMHFYAPLPEDMRALAARRGLNLPEKEEISLFSAENR